MEIDPSMFCFDIEKGPFFDKLRGITFARKKE